MVKRGKFDYETLTKIYCVAILVNDILPYSEFHTVANLRNEQGKLFDNQMTFITVELNKFTLQEVDCQTDLQKLIYTMKTIHTVTQAAQFPKFWDEEWLKVAIDELDSRKMTPDEKASLEILIARNAEAVNKEKRQLQKSAANLLGLNLLTVEQIATSLGVSVDFILSVQRQLSVK
jgi:hypothetical protein